MILTWDGGGGRRVFMNDFDLGFWGHFINDFHLGFGGNKGF